MKDDLRTSLSWGRRAEDNRLYPSCSAPSGVVRPRMPACTSARNRLLECRRQAFDVGVCVHLCHAEEPCLAPQPETAVEGVSTKNPPAGHPPVDADRAGPFVAHRELLEEGSLEEG